MEFLQILSYIIIYICLPVTGIATLVYLIILLKQITSSMKRIDTIADDVEKKLDLLQGPIDTIVDIHTNYLKAISAVSATMSTLSAFINRKKNK